MSPAECPISSKHWIGIIALVVAIAALGVVFLARFSPPEPAHTPEERSAFLYLQASTAFHEGNYQQAATELEQLERARPHDLRVVVMLGDSLIALGRLDEAKAAYERAVKLEPKRPESWSRLGVLRAQTGEVAAAREALTKALSMNPGDSDALEQKAELDAAQGRLDEAVLGLRAAARNAVAGQRPSLYGRAAGLLVENERIADAVALLREAREKGIVSTPLLELLGEYELRIGDLEGAEATYRQAAIAAERDPSLWFVLGEILLKLGRRTDAEQALRQSLQLEQRAATHIALGRLALARGDREAAEASLDAAATALSKASDGELLEIAELLLALKRPVDALRVLASLADEEAQRTNVALQRRTAKLAKRVGDTAILERACQRVQASEAGPCP